MSRSKVASATLPLCRHDLDGHRPGRADGMPRPGTRFASGSPERLGPYRRHEVCPGAGPLKLKQADSDLGGKLSVALDGQRPRVSGQLSSQLLRLPLRQRAGSSEKGQAVGLGHCSPMSRSIWWACGRSMGTRFEAAKLFAGGIELQGVKLQATLAGVVLTIDHLNGAFAGSPFESSGALDASGTVPTASLRLDSRRSISAPCSRPSS